MAILKNKDAKLRLPKELKKFSKEMRKIRLNQPWVSADEAYKQCRRVEMEWANSEK